MTPSRRTASCACPNSRNLSLLPCFLTSLLLFPPAGWRGARRRFVSGLLQIDSSAAVLVFLLMAAPPATRSGPPAGVLAGVPEGRPCSYRPPPKFSLPYFNSSESPPWRTRRARRLAPHHLRRRVTAGLRKQPPEPCCDVNVVGDQNPGAAEQAHSEDQQEIFQCRHNLSPFPFFQRPRKEQTACSFRRCAGNFPCSYLCS